MLKLWFTIPCVLMAITELVIAGILLKRKPEGVLYKAFARLMVIACITIVSYNISISSGSYFVMSLSSSVYFCSIDAVLLFMLDLIIEVTDFHMHLFQVVTRWMARIYGIFDCLVLLINPFYEIALHYVPDRNLAGHWLYDPGILYQLHLILCYIVVIMVAYCLVLKIVREPPLYRARYSLALIGLLAVVALNALFLFVSSMTGFYYDISVLLYGAMCMLVYYNTVHYAKRRLMQTAPAEILASLRSPVLLFDYEKKPVIANEAARLLLDDGAGRLTMDGLISRFRMQDKIGKDTENTSFQMAAGRQFFRCDFQTLRRKKRLIGYVFTFTEVSTEYDMLTGFRTEAAAQRDPAFTDPAFPTAVMLCDINRLSRINEKYGHEAGDRAIASVASIMRDVCPDGTCFVRRHDALLAAICPAVSGTEMKRILAELTARTEVLRTEQEQLKLVCTFDVCTNAQPEVRKAMDSAEEAIRVRKMLDPDSAHSSLLFSLARVMQESDPCTEQHVVRTRMNGEKLAERLGLSDEDSARLSLLCLLHDVGKLCIPLEILNKPVRLTKPEWELMKTHTWKGYQIAKASSELAPLAELILHHHERWDGKGYPSGLEKEEIPLLSRIIAIVDSFDAMTNERPYNQKVSMHQAVLNLEQGSGSQFDPHIVSVFCEMIRSQPAYLAEEKARTEGSAAAAEALRAAPAAEEPEQPDTDRQLSPAMFSRYHLDTDGSRILSADEHFTAMTGYTEEDIASGQLTQESLIFPEDRAAYNQMKDSMLSRSKEAYIEHRLRMKDGASRSVLCHGWSYYDSASRKLSCQIIIIDLTESAMVNRLINKERTIAQQNLRLWKESLRRDELTGLLNRTAFCNDLQEALTADLRTCAMVMCDIDFFKEYNDTRGHQQGDELLKSFGHILRGSVKDGGFACRMGGDEFAIALFFPKSADPAEIRKEADTFFDSVCEEMRQSGIEISVSMGMTCAADTKKTFEQMYDEADRALYLAKERGREQIAFCGF